ncbi:MAG TPA: cyanophycin synthetase [Flavobacteriaceae bacterium]|nr:cyanophycin synthetase [Flavobacteriaceae bacterium]
MKIRKINALKGPNYWSVYFHKLIVMVLDLEELEDRPTDEIPGFYENLQKLLPGLYSHQCSENSEGGFFRRVKRGTWMGHVAEHIALELQVLAGMDVSFGKTRGYGERGVYNVVFSYMEEEVGRYAAKASVRICEALIRGEKYDLEADIQEMREIREYDRLGPSTESIIEEAEYRGIPWMRLNNGSLCQLGYGEKQKRIKASITSETSCIGVDLASDKLHTKNLLEEAKVPVPPGKIVKTQDGLKEACTHIGFPVVIKPLDGNHGKGITVNINSCEEALQAFKIATAISSRVFVEKHIEGEDYRILVIDNTFVAAAKRSPARVIGDGRSTVAELVEKTNRDPRRGFGHEKALTKIKLDKTTENFISKKGYSKDSVLDKGEKLVLKNTANLSTGGTSEDVTDIVHPSNIDMAARISKLIGLDICGIDIVSPDISQPLAFNGGVVLEVNACPGLRMHLAPTTGLARNVAIPIMDKLFPNKWDTGRIPIVAVTGTNGKTTTTRLIAHMAKMKGFRVGYSTTDGVYIQNHLMMTGDCTGPKSAQFVLRDPTVNFAVLECARGGLLRSGLGFDFCDVGIVTNVEGDHLGLGGINTVEQLAKAKAVIPETVFPNGYAVLNADDDLVYEMRKNLRCKIALFSLTENNPRIIRFQKEGGITAIYENGYVTLCRGTFKMRVIKAEKIPLTFNGKAQFMIQNILAAIIAADVQGIGIVDMKAALETFVPSAIQTPGRMNLFQFKNFKFLLDYAHNPASLQALKQFTDRLTSPKKTGIVTGIGDRLIQDTFDIGRISAEMFDEIIIRLDQDLRGKTQSEIIGALKEGIYSVDANKKIILIPDEMEAIKYSIAHAEPQSLIVLFTEKVQESLKLVQNLKDEEIALGCDVKAEIVGISVEDESAD